MSTNPALSHIADVEKITERVTRILGCNPGPMTLQGTNCHLVGSGKSKILIDTGEHKNEKFLDNLQRHLSQNELSLQEIIITHWHPDHTGGIEDIAKISGISLNISKFPRVSGNDRPLREGLSYNYVEDGHVFKTEGATLRAIYTPGHADDHMSLVLEEENAVFSGDTVLGEGTTQFEDLYDYMLSLDKILHLRSDRIYPSHGALIENTQKHLEMYISHRNMREQQIMEAVQDSSYPLSAEDIVKIVYIGLSNNLVRAAAGNVWHHLSKLIKEERVVEVSNGFFSASGRCSSNL